MSDGFGECVPADPKMVMEYKYNSDVFKPIILSDELRSHIESMPVVSEREIVAG